jgi:amino acid transporter
MSGPAQGDLRRVIGFWGGTALIVGIVIGAGIFRKPYTLASDVGHPGVILALWIGFGLVSICGALALAELASMMPRTGGAYVYLRAAYGDGAAFVFGWIYLLVATPAAVGALGTFFAELLLGLLKVDLAKAGWVLPGIGAGTIALLTVVNLIGTRFGSAVQSVFTLVKVAALFLLIFASFAHGGSFSHLEGGRTVDFASFGKGVASVIWAYDGWIAVSMIAGEIVGAERIMRRVIVVGMLVIAGLYVFANIGYIFALPLGEMAVSKGGVPQRILGEAFGPWAGSLIGAAIMCSVFGALNGNVLAKPRVPYALAQDGLTFSFLGRAHPRWSTPYSAILIQSAMAVAMVFLLRDPKEPTLLFDKLTTYFVVVEWAALLFAVGAVFVLRRKMPDAPRPFMTPGYPWVPLFFLVGATVGLTAIVWGEVKAENWTPIWGLLIALAGFPVHAVWRRLKRR